MYDDRIPHSVNSSAIWKCAIMTRGVAAGSAAAFALLQADGGLSRRPALRETLRWQQRRAEVCRRDLQHRCRLRHNIRLLRTRKGH